jgi:hypothetical protein
MRVRERDVSMPGLGGLDVFGVRVVAVQVLRIPAVVARARLREGGREGGRGRGLMGGRETSDASDDSDSWSGAEDDDDDARAGRGMRARPRRATRRRRTEATTSSPRRS